MTSRFWARSLTTVAALGALFIGLSPLSATQAPTSPKKNAAVQKPTGPAKPAVKAGYVVPRTPDGKPDFQGLWTNATVTPLERPKGAKEFLTAEEVIAAEKRGNRDDEEDTDSQRGTKDDAAAQASRAVREERRQERVASGAGGDAATGNYNAIWWQLGKRALANNRSSIIVDGDGRLPHTPAVEKLLDDTREYVKDHPADGPEGRDNIERCLAWISSGLPMLPTFYNNKYQFIQTPHSVGILVEMIHDLRIIPTDSHARLDSAVQQWVGDSRGHWDGDTLVVETTNLNSKRNFIGGGGGRAGLAPNNDRMHVVERFTRTAPDILLYQFTVENPAIYTRPWSGEIPMRATTEPLYEYACHEGNYALVDILGGARAEEKAAAAKQRDK
jgi:hypothetical protein